MSDTPKTTTGAAGGTHISSEPLTLDGIRTASPDLLRNSIDSRIVRIRPMSTPLDQISRCAPVRRAASMSVEYYSVDTKATQAKLISTYSSGGTLQGDLRVCTLKTTDNSIFDPSETILVPAVKGGNGQPLVLYVLETSAENITVTPINGVALKDAANSEGQTGMPVIPAGSLMIRMGRAAAELDVQTAQFSALPKKARNNCQIFKMQVEQSTMARIASKEVGWTFSDQEEAAVIDMRLGMEKSFLFGTKSVIHDPNKRQDVYLTGGIWNQTDNETIFSVGELSESDVIDICAAAFNDQAGSKRKILLAGTNLLQALNRLTFTRCVSASESFVKWGVEFREIRSNFGTLFVVHSEVFDQCGHADDGFVLDPDYVTKYVHIPFRADTLDLRSSGQRNTDAVVLTEASCLVLRYPKAHMRLLGV